MIDRVSIVDDYAGCSLTTPLVPESFVIGPDGQRPAAGMDPASSREEFRGGEHGGERWAACRGEHTTSDATPATCTGTMFITRLDGYAATPHGT